MKTGSTVRPPDAVAPVPTEGEKARSYDAPFGRRASRAGGSRAELLLIAAIAVGVRLIGIDHAPWIDELYHMMAAKSLLTDGTLHINGAVEYTRARLFTWLIAGQMALLGDSLVVARMPAVLAGTALVVGTFAWLRRFAGRSAAWSAALLLCFAPISLYLSQQTRFYTVQTLLFCTGALALFYAASAVSSRSRGWLVGAAAACFAVALHLHIITLVGMAALGLWLLADRAPAIVRWTRADVPRRSIIVAAVTLAAAVVLGLALILVWPSAIRIFTYADLWAEGDRNNLRFYHDAFLSQYPTLWALFPIAVLIAASRHPRATFFLVVPFSLVLLFHSMAAWKHERYVFYVLPAFFAVWGLALGVILPWLRLRLETLGRGRRTAVRVLPTVLIAAALLFAAASNRATIITYRMLTVADADWTMSIAYRGEADWQRALPVLRPAAADADVVIASSMLKGLYFLDRLDFGLSATEVVRAGDDQEFAIAAREGVPVIGRSESLALVHTCFSSGLVIVEERGWREEWGVRDPTADYLEQSMERLTTPAGGGILAFRWNQDAAAARQPAGAAGQPATAGEPAETGPDCDAVRRLLVRR